MANELQLAHAPTRTVYAIIRNAAGQVWNGTTFVDQDNDDWADYAVALDEIPEDGGFYAADFPAGVTAGAYGVVAYQQAGGQPALADDRIGIGTLAWSGTAAIDAQEMTRRLALLMEVVT